MLPCRAIAEFEYVLVARVRNPRTEYLKTVFTEWLRAPAPGDSQTTLAAQVRESEDMDTHAACAVDFKHIRVIPSGPRPGSSTRVHV